VVTFRPRPLYPKGKGYWHPLDRRLGGLQSQSGRGGEEKNSQSPPEIDRYNPDNPGSVINCHRHIKEGETIGTYNTYGRSEKYKQKLSYYNLNG
jgi:hypothetical protein